MGCWCVAAWESGRRAGAELDGIRTIVLNRLQFIVRRCIWLSVALVASYMASPFLAAYLLHGAIKQGYVAYIEPRVDWLSVRASLKESITARLAEQSVQRTDDGLWSSLKHEVVDTVSPYVLDYMIDNKVTAAGFVDYLKPKPASKKEPTLEMYRGRWNLSVITPVEAAEITLKTPEIPGADMLKRIDRAQFTSLTSFEFEVRDRFDEGRRYRATLELKHYQWMLTRVDVLSLGKKAL
jgi:Protein of unknown function (DUF2939)